MFRRLTPPSSLHPQAHPTGQAALGRIGSILVLALAAACAGETTSPDHEAAAPADVVEHAFLLTFDVATGRVTVREPRQASPTAAVGAAGLSLSLLGSDAIRLHAGDCAFSSIPNNSKQKRCTMTLSVENRLSAADLVTPTTFPRPPAGATGILVFPYTAAALGVPGGAAVPNASWDGAPANFFNDFAGCTVGKTSDCYRWEGYASPLYGGATSETRTVGFDVDKSANNAAVYVVVAADLRDNPTRTLTLLPEAANCGDINNETDHVFVDLETLQVRSQIVSLARRSFCSFDIGGLPADADILSADLRLLQTGGVGSPASLGPVLVDHLDYGILDLEDFDRTALTSNIGNFPVTAQPTRQALTVTAQVIADQTASRERSQYRLRMANENSGESAAVNFSGPASFVPPELVITYRTR